MIRMSFRSYQLLTRKTIQRCSSSLPHGAVTWLEDISDILQPKTMHICDGSQEEREAILQELMDAKIVVKCQQQANCFVARSDPNDTGRDPNRVFVSAYNRDDFLTSASTSSCEGTPPRGGNLLGNYLPVTQVDEEIKSRFFKSMKGKKMYVVPFVLGPGTGDTKIMGIQVTDSGLTALMTCMLAQSGLAAQLEMSRKLTGNSCYSNFVKLIHASGCHHTNPPNWPSNRERHILITLPEKKEIWSFGSSYWENSLLIKKGAALQLASNIGRKEKFLAAQMSVFAIENPCCTRYIGVMGPAGSGKTVMAAMTGNPGPCPINVKMVSDDISWIKLNADTGVLHAINPETGILPFVKGVNRCNTPVLHKVACENSIMLNTGLSGNDSAWWEGIDAPDKDHHEITDWRGKPWSPDGLRAAHLDARFCNSMVNISNLDARWESGMGVPLSAIIVLTRRNEGHPLILETESWLQGVLHMASIRTRYHNQPLDCEKVHWEPMGCRSYLGYNLGLMIENWMSLATVKDIKLPKIFLVNLFLTDNWMKEHMWMGYEQNASIVKWILDRLDCKAKGQPCPIGLLPCEKEFEMPMRQIYTFDSMVSYDEDYWNCEMIQFEKLLKSQLPEDIPELLCREVESMKCKLTPCPCVPCPCPCPC